MPRNKNLPKKQTGGKKPKPINVTKTKQEFGIKGRRFKPGTVALREIKRYQKSVALLIPKAPFQRFIVEIT